MRHKRSLLKLVVCCKIAQNYEPFVTHPPNGKQTKTAPFLAGETSENNHGKQSQNCLSPWCATMSFSKKQMRMASPNIACFFRNCLLQLQKSEKLNPRSTPLRPARRMTPNDLFALTHQLCYTKHTWRVLTHHRCDPLPVIRTI